jgi:YbbR domain-containing protein
MLILRNILKKIFFEDWTTKLIALAITLGLWLGVTGLSTPVTRRIADIPLSFNYPNNVEITNTPLQTISIVVSGDKRRVNQLEESKLNVSLDLSDLQVGDRVVNLTPDTVKIDLPLGVRLVEVQPSRIAIRLENVEQRSVPVRVETAGQPAEGFELYSESIDPPRVTIRGPVSYLKALDSVSTEKIDISGKNADFIARQVPIIISNPKATVLETVVDVTLRIGEKRIERVLIAPVSDSSAQRASVTIYGPMSVVESIKPQDLHIIIDRQSDKPVVNNASELGQFVEIRRIRLL